MSANLPPRNQAHFTLGEIAQSTNGILHGDPQTKFCGIVTDTRLLESDAASTCRPLFVALRGTNFDGHRFVHSALESGANAVLIEHSARLPFFDAPFVQVENTQTALGELAKFHRKRFDIPLIGVTGSYGKTTTRALIETVLRSKFNVLASQENFNNEIGVALTLLQLNESHQVAVIEMGMRGLGQIRTLAQMASPTIGVITNIGPQHIELLGSLENIARAKAELLECLPTDGIAILPAESEWLPLLKDLSPRHWGTFGTTEKAFVRVLDVVTTPDGNIEFTLELNNEWYCHTAPRLRASLPLPGAHNAINAAAAMAVLDASDLGVPSKDILKQFSQIEIPGARMRIVRTNTLTIIDDCYNAGPDSMRAALQVLADSPNAARRVAILGAMRELGEWTQEEHRKIGQLAMQSGVQVLVGVGEETKAMIEASRETGSDCVFDWAQNAEDAIEIARDLVREHDVVLVKGSRSVGLEKVVNALNGS